MTLVLQCAMCGTLHPVGTASCSTCRATGVGQLRLMFECPTCHRLGLNPACGACPAATPADPNEELIVAEEVLDEAYSLDEIEVGGDDAELVLDFDEDEADESLVVDESDDGTDLDEDAFDLDADLDSDLDDDDFDLDEEDD